MMDSDFPKFSFSLESVNFYHWQQMLSVVFLGITDSLYLSLRTCLPDMSILITTVCSSFK